MKRRDDPSVSGVLVVDKPEGPTSHDVVDRVRAVLGVRRVGHTGTLDPLATGVLAVCVGKATRLARFLTASEKEYRATVRLGFATTTDDAAGEPLGAPRAVGVDAKQVRAAAGALVGEVLQVPPAFSAKRVAGRRAYDLAREGVAVAPQPVPVTVHALEVVEVEGSRVVLDVRCSAGTYVRSIARDLGERLGLGAHLTALRRTRSGSFTLSEAVPLADLAAAGRGRLLPLGALLPEWPSVRVEEPGALALRHGRDLDEGLVASGFPESAVGWMRVIDGEGRLLALAHTRGFEPPGPGLVLSRVLHPEIVLAD